jgi:hypothetical protein
MILLSDVMTVGFTFVFSLFFETFLHQASHYKESGLLYKWHRLHHKDYPAKNLESEIFIYTTGWTNNMFAFWILVTQGTFFLVSSNRVFLIFYIQSTSYAFFVEYMHQQYHLKNSWWLHFQWFQRLKKNHLLHHIKHHKNYGMFTDQIDKINGSFQES